MNRRIAKFEKVSFEQWMADLEAHGLNVCAEESDFRKAYDEIELPTRATKGSGGYDFKAPFGFVLPAGDTIVIPTGIRCKIDEEWELLCLPKSGQGFKYRVQLDNTIGLIDSDYYYSENEGHIIAKITNDGHEGKVMSVDRGKGFIQGTFVMYGITEDDDADGIRNGGFGSTG